MKEKIDYEFELTKDELEKILVDHLISSDKLPEYIDEDKNTYTSSRMTPPRNHSNNHKKHEGRTAP